MNVISFKEVPSIVRAHFLSLFVFMGYPLFYPLDQG